MMHPFTCLSLVAALGSGLYLYQEKHRAQLLDREISRTVHQADQARDRIGLLKAEWALLNEPERLGSLAAQHLPLRPLQPAQYARMEDLRTRLPVAALAPAAMDEPAAPVAAPLAEIALPAAQAAGATLPVPPAASASVRAAAPVQAAARPAAAKPAAPRAVAKARETEPALTPSRPILASVMPAYAPATAAVHAPTVQTASVSAAAQPFIGSALGMARTMLAAPMPVASAATLGYAASR